jgi:hypothetical protein
MNTLLVFLSLIPRLLFGVAILQRLEIRNSLLKISLSPALGFGGSSLFAFLWLWAGLPIAIYAILEIVLILTFTMWILLLLRNRTLNDIRLISISGGLSPLWFALLSVGIVIFIVNLMTTAFQFPHGGMDAWMNWNVVSRFIALGGDDWENTFLRSLGHPDYPLFMTITNALTWVFTRNDTVWGPIVFHFLLSLFTAGLLFSLVSALKDTTQAALAGILFMTQTFIAGHSMSQLADFPLAYFILGTGGVTLLYIKRSQTQYALLAGFLAGLAAWTKNEGLVTVGSFTLVWFILGLQKGWESFKGYLAGLAFPLTVVVLFKVFLAPPNDLASSARNILGLATDSGRIALILKEAAKTLWNFNESPIHLIGLIIVYGVIIGKSRLRPAGLWLLGFVIFIQLSAYFAVYLITPHDLEWHLRTSLSRLYMHMFPLVLLCFFAWIRSPQELASKES